MSTTDDVSNKSYDDVEKNASQLKDLSKKGTSIIPKKAKVAIYRRGKKVAQKAGGLLLRAGKGGLLALGKFLLVVGCVFLAFLILEALLLEIEYEVVPQNKMYINSDNEYRSDTITTTSEYSEQIGRSRRLNAQSSINQTSIDDTKVILSEENQAVENYHYYNSTQSHHPM